MTSKTNPIAGIVAIIAVIGLLVGGIIATVAAVQEFGLLGLFLDRGIFRIGMLWGNGLFMTGLAIDVASIVALSFAKAFYRS